jgi:hypothetical protein
MTLQLVKPFYFLQRVSVFINEKIALVDLEGASVITIS